MPNATSSELQSLLECLIKKHGVVGASLAVFNKGAVEVAAAGQLNVNTGVEVTPDSLFQIGSISKVFTTSVIMRLVDEGRVDLDKLVVEYLPNFQLADMTAARTIKVRHLLCHISGMEGDYFPDDDPFSTSTESYVQRCALLPQLHPVGKYNSYSNSAFTVAGRVVEVVTGKPWAEVVSEFIFKPLNMQEAISDPKEILRFRGAIGHVQSPDDAKEAIVVPKTYLPLSMAPAGTVLSMSARDLMKFAEMHLHGGKSQAGKSVLSVSAVKQMQTSQFTLPEYPRGITDWGLGWFLTKRPQRKTFGHTGGTMGQFAYLYMAPEHNFGYALLTNSSSGLLQSELDGLLFEDYAGVPAETDPEILDTPVDTHKYVGVYGNIGAKVEVREEHSGLICDASAVVGAPTLLKLEPVGDDAFMARGSAMPSRSINFVDTDTSGRAAYLYTGGRLLKRF